MGDDVESQTRRIADRYADINARLMAIERERVPSLCGPCGVECYENFYDRTEWFGALECAACGRAGARRPGEKW